MSQRAIREAVYALADVVRGAVNTAAAVGDIRSWERRADWAVQAHLAAKALKPIIQADVDAAAKKAARRVRKAEDPEVATGSGGFFFNEPNPFAKNWASTRSADLITAISDSMRSAVRGYVTDAINDGTPPRSLAKQLEGVIGLRPDQADALAAQRAQLMEDGRAQDEIDRLIAARGTRMLTQRASMVARTEIAYAQSAGQMQEWAQQAADGDLPEDSKRVWLDADGCPICVELAAADPVGIGQPWHSSTLGAVWAPPAHPHCRCSQAIA